MVGECIESADVVVSSELVDKFSVESIMVVRLSDTFTVVGSDDGVVLSELLDKSSVVIGIVSVVYSSIVESIMVVTFPETVLFIITVVVK